MGGEHVAVELLKVVGEAEEKAAAVRREASEAAKATVEKAQREADALYEQAVAAANTKAEELLGKARTAAGEKAGRHQQEIAAGCDEIRRAAQKNMEKAIDIIVAKVVSVSG
ncbi:hypothetical protein SDC9_71961 [bioreactor metagenome]|uniref:V-type ATP synthase subunit H n=1 Tax=bioreactor metagenome TaxID=1076179 RepID=A0A644YBB4_9ZZZZ